MNSYNYLMLPILGSVLIGVVGGIRSGRGIAWTMLNAAVAGFASCLMVSSLFLVFLMAPMASPGFSDWIRVNDWINAAAAAGLLFLPPLGAWLTVRLLRLL